MCRRAKREKGSDEKPRRSSLPRGLKPEDVTLEKALALLSLPREVARHPTSGEPILAGIGRYGAYVQHGKTYANLGRDDDVLEIGANRAIDLIVAKESGAALALRRRRGGPGARRASRGRRGQRQAGPVRRLRQSRQGQRDDAAREPIPASLTLDDAVALLAAKAAGGGVSGRLLGDHPDGGPVTVRDGRFGPYVNWGKVNATIPKSTPPDSISLSEALDLLAEREGKPAPSARRAPAKAPAKKAAPAKATAKSATAKAKSATAKKKPAAKGVRQEPKPKAAAGRT